jgi:hypothetical protein
MRRLFRIHPARENFRSDRIKMEKQPGICVIDLFGVSYDGTLPSIVFACDEVWFGLFAVAPPNPPDVESAARPDGRHSLSL